MTDETCARAGEITCDSATLSAFFSRIFILDATLTHTASEARKPERGTKDEESLSSTLFSLLMTAPLRSIFHEGLAENACMPMFDA